MFTLLETLVCSMYEVPVSSNVIRVPLCASSIYRIYIMLYTRACPCSGSRWTGGLLLVGFIIVLIHIYSRACAHAAYTHHLTHHTLSKNFSSSESSSPNSTISCRVMPLGASRREQNMYADPNKFSFTAKILRRGGAREREGGGGSRWRGRREGGRGDGDSQDTKDEQCHK